MPFPQCFQSIIRLVAASLRSISLDCPLGDHLLLIRFSSLFKHKLPILALAFLIFGDEDTDWELEYVQLRDAGAGVAEGGGGAGIDGQRGDFRDRIPTVGGDSWVDC